MANDKHHLKQLFDLCVNQPIEKQQSIIANSHYSDEIKQKVNRLLKTNIDDVELTGVIIDSVQVGLNIKPITVGMKIDSYVLVKLLGQGAQGEIWLAQRESGDFNHQVAIKFLKPVHNKAELQRFQNERELLARLKHNNIAQLLGGGELADNRLYIILELVEGKSLIDYCQSKKFTLKEYLHCFMQICDAIIYAHSHLVIHRDIKPSNIIITDEGIVKLLDFGIAKVINTEPTNLETLPIMTLAYSSPEQVNGTTISTATDIYTLGLLLYEMLTGKRAQASSTDVPTALIDKITDKAPIIPSKVDVLLKLSRNYSNKHLKGDLDNLIMKAVRKEPSRRYLTVASMAADVNNYLTGRPLIATGDSRWYKLKKLVFRNPAVSFLSVLTFGFLITLPVILLSNKQQVEKQRDLEILAKKQAQEQTILAERTTEFLFNILESASPLASKGQSINLDDVLKSAERQLAQGLDNLPQLKITLLHKLAGIWHHIGNNKKAISYYEKALTLSIESSFIQEQLYALGQLAILHYFIGETEDTYVYRKKANALALKIKDPLVSGWHQARMATLSFYLGEKERNRQIIPEVISSLSKNNITDAKLLGRLYNELSIVTSDVDKQKALDYINIALQYAESLHGRMHPKYQTRLINKADILVKMERYEEAESIFSQAKIDAEKLYTKNHPAYSKVIAELASLYHDKGRFSETEKLYKQALVITEKTNGKNSLEYVLTSNNLGYLYEDMGQYEKAEKYYRESLQIRKSVHSGDKLRVASSQANLARLLAKITKYEESQSLLNKVIPLYILNNKSNLANNITQIAITIAESCESGLKLINEVLPEVNKVPSKSWRRMYYELWLGQMAYQCQATDLAKFLLKSVQEKSSVIYTINSDGQKRVYQLTQDILNKMTL